MTRTARQFGRALAAGILLLAGTGASAEQTVITRVLDACGTEIRDLCSNITGGNGRVIACLYANEDQLSHRCDYVLFDAAAELQQIMGAMSQVAEVCKADIEHLCGNVVKGEGRLMQCLKTHQMALSAPCHDAFENAGIHVN